MSRPGSFTVFLILRPHPRCCMHVASVRPPACRSAGRPACLSASGGLGFSTLSRARTLARYARRGSASASLMSPPSTSSPWWPWRCLTPSPGSPRAPRRFVQLSPAFSVSSQPLLVLIVVTYSSAVFVLFVFCFWGKVKVEPVLLGRHV